jgi:hypothetical protein
VYGFCTLVCHRVTVVQTSDIGSPGQTPNELRNTANIQVPM